MSLQAIAAEFIGQREIPENKGFEDKDFHKLMQRTGWRKPLAWCAYFVKACLLVAKERGEVYADLVSPSAVSTYNAYRKAGRVYAVSPRPGDLVVWQKYANGKPTQYGHIGVVADPRPIAASEGVDGFWTIEGNTDESGSREGDCVAYKLRKLSYAKKANGLVLLGFCRTGM